MITIDFLLLFVWLGFGTMAVSEGALDVGNFLDYLSLEKWKTFFPLSQFVQLSFLIKEFRCQC